MTPTEFTPKFEHQNDTKSYRRFYLHRRFLANRGIPLLDHLSYIKFHIRYSGSGERQISAEYAFLKSFPTLL